MSVPRISTDELKLRLDSPPGDRPVIVDARLKYPYEHSTIVLPGAHRVAAGPPGLAGLPPEHDIVVYDSDPEEIVAERVAADLIAAGRRAFVLAGGIAAWAGAKLPTETKSAPQPAVPPGAQKG